MKPSHRSPLSRVVRAAGLAPAVLALVALAPCARAGDGDKPPASPGDKPAMPDGAKPPTAPAEAPTGVTGRFFDTYDANQDGKVTKDEYTGDPAVFDLLDKNHDGVITTDELGLPPDYKPTRSERPPMDERGPAEGRGGNLRERMEKFKLKLAEWDTNKDGKVTREEYAEHKGKLPFEFLDRNKDGVITMDDIGPGGGGGEPRGKGEKGSPMPTSPEEAAARFTEADKNGDGKITRDEFPGPQEKFDALDKNHDGAITPDEMEAALREGGRGERGMKGRRMFENFDKNHDGKVTRDEFPGSDEAFRKMDKNGDGAITPDELPEFDGGKGMKRRGGEKGGAMAPDGEPMAPPPAEGGAPARPAAGLSPLFTALDKNHDGKISRDEWPGTDEEWRRLDKNGDGWISPEEAR